MKIIVITEEEDTRINVVFNVEGEGTQLNFTSLLTAIVCSCLTRLEQIEGLKNICKSILNHRPN